MMSEVGLDQHDERILSELQSDARITMAELGRRVGLSQPAVTERVRKLETSGIITGYHAAVDPGPARLFHPRAGAGRAVRLQPGRQVHRGNA